VIAIPNGVYDSEPRPRKARNSDGRLSLGSYKGAVLLEAFLRTGKFDRLKLTMVDWAMEANPRSEMIWGNMP
jgi:hypothetical protein